MSSVNVSNSNDPKRPDKIHRYHFPTTSDLRGDVGFTTQEVFDLLAIIWSLNGLLMKLTCCTWIALFCSTIGFAHSRGNYSKIEVFSSFMLSFSAILMSYLQNPQPMYFTDFSNYTR
ncbi:unnamed protein product [Larinioides sclopetarius]|uniref:Protein Asterix n=1 Tax=Larinioides sclopetarius TaxID=280406 RepID=A0AAV1ZWX2_9ARAC